MVSFFLKLIQLGEVVYSTKVFDILAALERGNNAIDEIHRIVV